MDKDGSHEIPPVVQQIFRLTPQVYADLEKQVARFDVRSDTSPQEVGFMLGVQFVLRKLRDGYVTA